MVCLFRVENKLFHLACTNDIETSGVVSKCVHLRTNWQSTRSPTQVAVMRLIRKLRDAESVGGVEVCKPSLTRRCVESSQSFYRFSGESNYTRRTGRFFEDESRRRSSLEDGAVATDIVKCNQCALNVNFVRGRACVVCEFRNVLLREFHPSQILRPKVGRRLCRRVEGFVNDEIIGRCSDLGEISVCSD
jgi:hypothetical protein